jgi:sulfhydrogenase subunit beta (sulfur reductase)
MDIDGLDALFGTLEEEGYTIVGPTVRDQAIVYDTLDTAEDLPIGIADDQEGGHYRLTNRADDARFGYNLGQSSWKRFLYPPRTTLFRATRGDDGIVFETADDPAPRYAFVGVRACELAAIDTQDGVFLGPAMSDRTYASRRSQALMIAVNCGQAAATCFCTSMGTGPRCTTGYDIVMTEIIDGGTPTYVVDSGSERGTEIMRRLPGRDATPDDIARADEVPLRAERDIVRTMDTDGIRDLLVHNPNHQRWADVADRCLACGNCTLVCPTCFCSTTEDTVTLDGTAIRSRRWDSCFALDFTALHGRPVRGDTRSRYRQWMTHKLATWHDQFGRSGCVGCGRCITWCPVGIDITQEVAAMRETVTS